MWAYIMIIYHKPTLSIHDGHQHFFRHGLRLLVTHGMLFTRLKEPLQVPSETQPVPKQVERKNPSQTPLALQGWQVRKRAASTPLTAAIPFDLQPCTSCWCLMAVPWSPRMKSEMTHILPQLRVRIQFGIGGKSKGSLQTATWFIPSCPGLPRYLHVSALPKIEQLPVRRSNTMREISEILCRSSDPPICEMKHWYNQLQ